MKRDDLIVVRGGGDLATGVVHRLWSAGLRVLVLETAHPAKFKETVENIIGKPVEIPAKLQEFMKGTKQSTAMSSDFETFKTYLMEL